MAVKQQPHYPHHVREMHRTRRRFWSALAAFVLIMTATGYYQVGQSLATTYYLAGTVTKGVSGGSQVAYPGIQVRVTDYLNGNAVLGTATTNASGVWSIAGLGYQAQVRVFIVSATPAGYYAPVATEFSALGMAVATRSDYPYQLVAGSCYQNSACSNSNYRAYDIAAAHEHSMNFSYTAPATSVSGFTASPSSIAYGAKTTLSWTTVNTASCSISPGGPINTTVKSWVTGALTASTTYTVSCKSAAGYASSRTVGVTVAAAPPPPTPVPTVAPTATPKPGTSPTPTPTSSPKPGATPTPIPGTTPTPSGGGGSTGGGTTGGSTGGTSGGTSKTPATPDTTPPSPPTDFQALVSGTNAVMNLSWTAASDNVSVQNYILERSLDEQQWTVLTNEIIGTTYTDDSLGYDVTYYYRLKAADAAGNMSTYVATDGHTPVFTANNDSGSPVTYTSDDAVAQVVLPAGAIDGEADCSIEAQTETIDTGKLKVASGPFVLVCKNSSGDAVTAITSPVSWKFKLKDKLKGLTKPQAYQLDDSGNVVAVKDYKYDAKTGELTYTMATLNPALVLASKGTPFPWNFVAIVLLVLGIIAGVLLMIVRQTQKRSYDDYLTKKYYNL